MITISTRVPYPSLDGTQPCLDDPETWHPAEGDKDTANRAKTACKTRCKFTSSCLAWAMAHDEVGIWGGTERDERRIRRPGRAPLAKEVGVQVVELREAGLSIAQTAKRLGISVQSVSKLRAEARAAQ